jgi:8-oxo-dGTP pyrophosphatase MutT (NUDIX family)
MNIFTIHFNDKKIVFTTKPNVKQFQKNELAALSNAETEKKIKEDFQWYIKQDKFKALFFINENQTKIRALFLKQFNFIEAAGGVIQSTKGILFIYRNNKWDLPKGKVEKKEKIPLAAIRECEEECGIKELGIIKKLLPTFHLYKLNGKFILKITHWFLMTAPGKQKLKAQKEEGISKVKWFKNIEIHKPLKNTYPSIREIFSYIQTP